MSEERRALTGFPAVQEPRDALRSLQQTVINIRERLRQIEAQANLDIAGGNQVTGNAFPEAPVDGNVYGRRNRAWWMVKATGLKFTYASDPPGENAPGDEWFDPDLGLLFTWVDDGSSKQWVELAGRGQNASALTVVVDVYDTPGTYNWIKPANAKYIEAVIVAGGGGGGGGSWVNYGGFGGHTGGAGGGGGAYLHVHGHGESFNSLETVIVGAGGAAGIGVTGAIPNWLGNPGSAGGASSFAGLKCYGGGGGNGGTNFGCAAGGGGGLAGAGQTFAGGAFGGANGGEGSSISKAGASCTNPCGGSGGGGQSGVNDHGYNGGQAQGGAQGGGSGAGSWFSDFMWGGSAHVWGSADMVLGGTGVADPHGKQLSGIAQSLRGAGGGGGAGTNSSNITTGGGGWGGAGQQPGGGGGGGGAGYAVGPGPGGPGGAGFVAVVTYIEA